MKKVGLLTSLLVGSLLLTGCNQQFNIYVDKNILTGEVSEIQNIEEASNEDIEIVDSNIVQYDYITNSINTGKNYVKQLIDNFQGNIINGTNLDSVDIKGDYTLYYNDRLGLAVILGNKWKGGRILTNSYETSDKISFNQRNDNRGTYFDLFGFQIFNEENYSKVDYWGFGDREYFESETIGKNNKYNFVQFYTNTTHDEIYDTIPTLDCKERMIQDYKSIACDGYEIINGGHIKTGKSRIEQLFPNGFIFYDID